MPLIARIFGADVDPRIWPVVSITVAYNVAFSTFWVLLGVFAVRDLGWAPAQVGLLFLASSPAAAAANFASGRLSDALGRRRLIVASFLTASAVVAAMIPARGHDPLPAALVVALGMAGAPALTLAQVVVADIVHDEQEQERAFATVRLAGNLGVLAGPPAAAAVIVTAGWTALLAAIAIAGLIGGVIAALTLPETHAAAPRGAGMSALRRLRADRAFLLLVLSTLLGYTVYCGFETVLPVIAVADYGVPAETWGLLLTISPLMVVLFQLRLTRAAAWVGPGPRLAAAMALMGLPLLVLTGGSSVAVIAGVIAVFVVGEMLWIPTSQAVAARLAPADVRGTYFGVLSATTGPAWTFAPFLALHLEAAAGPSAVWVMFAAVALAGAAAGVAAIRTASADEIGVERRSTGERQCENDGKDDEMGKSLTPCLWFDTQAEDAARFYTSVFPNSKIVSTSYYGEAGPRDDDMVLTVEFELDGKPFVALNGGPEFTFSEAISFQIDCKDQDEVDRYWEALSAGGEEGPCGWVKDRFGLSWQVVPNRLAQLLKDHDRDRANRVMAAMMKMGKIDIAELDRAADGAQVA